MLDLSSRTQMIIQSAMHDLDQGGDPARIRAALEEALVGVAKLGEQSAMFHELFSYERQKHNATIAERDLARRRYSAVAKGLKGFMDILDGKGEVGMPFALVRSVASLVNYVLSNEKDDSGAPHPAFGKGSNAIKPYDPEETTEWRQLLKRVQDGLVRATEPYRTSPAATTPKEAP